MDVALSLFGFCYSFKSNFVVKYGLTSTVNSISKIVYSVIYERVAKG